MKTMKFNVWDDKPSIVYRPGTSDEAIIKAVLIDRVEYAFPAMKPKLIFDIGANIGVLSVLFANLYPEAKIVAFEPIKENFDILKENVSHYPNVKPCFYGIGAEDGKFRIYPSDDPTNLGGFSNKIKVGEGSLCSLVGVSSVCQEFGVPDLIKIDTEGSEFDILTHMPNLDQVKWIAGELHGIRDYELLAVLDDHFKLQLSRGFGDKVWHFHAVSKAWTDFGRDQTPQPQN